MELKRIAVDCLLQHFKTLYQQSIDGQAADFGEPCAKCPYNKECGCNWYENIAPALEGTKIPVSFPLPNDEWDQERQEQE